PETVAESVLRGVVAAAGVPVAVHCCAAAPPVALLHRAGAAALSLDLTLLGPDSDEGLGEAAEAGVVLMAGVVAAADTTMSDPAATVEPVRRVWHRLGLPPESLATGVVVTPTCGLAGASPGHARAALRHARAAGQVLVDDPEG
ncbi:MAG: methionine synthase, partial [Actinomycetes bacterium]